MQTGRLQGASIVIVGGTSGMGLSTALACLREGAHVTVAGRDDAYATPAAERLGSETPCVLGDATDPALATRVFDAALDRFGRVDGVFHVAGGSGRRFGDGPLDQVTDEGWQQTLDLNLTALFHTNRAAVRHFLRASHGTHRGLRDLNCNGRSASPSFVHWFLFSSVPCPRRRATRMT